MGSWEDAQAIKAEAQKVLLDQLKLLNENSHRTVDANSGVPAMNLAAMSQQMANIGRVLCDNGWRPKQ